MNYTFKKNCYKSIQAVMVGVSVLGLFPFHFHILFYLETMGCLRCFFL